MPGMGMPVPAAGPTPMGFSVLEHVPGGDQQAEQARMHFLEARYDQIFEARNAALALGLPSPVVFLVDHGDDRGLRLANWARTTYGHGGAAGSTIRELPGPYGMIRSEAVAVPTMQARNILAAESLPHLSHLLMYEMPANQVVVIVMSVYGATGLRVGLAIAG
jgi:hypothetical protein